VLHFIGLAMLLGSILAFIVIGAVPVPEGDVAAVHHYRRLIRIMTWVLTVPGMLLVALTGLTMTIVRGYGFLRVGWLTLKQLAMLVILANAAFLLVPYVEQLFALSLQGLAQGALPPEYAVLKVREDIAGTVNFLFILASIALAVLRPFPGWRRSAVADA
jgi:uncharacterized membrane protein